MVKGVRAVVNRIEVRPTPRADDALGSDVVGALLRDPAADAWEIEVRAEDGKITLDGEVDSWREWMLAERLTKGVRGVSEVDNRLTVAPQAPRTDYEIRADVESALRWDARIDDALVEVAVDSGVVMLTGTVGSAFEKNLAERRARVTGVESVEADDLSVEWWARDEMMRDAEIADLSDEEIHQAVEDALLLDPRVRSFEPVIEVDRGIVTLTGTVSNVKARRAAAQDAANTTGVWRVKNYLKVRPLVDKTDADIADQIRNALLVDPFVERYEIDVHVHDGAAVLAGEVTSYFEKWQAEDLAARVSGVTSVVNRLQVENAPHAADLSFYDWDVVDTDYDFDLLAVTQPSDWMIRQDIEEEMFWSPFVDANQVDVTVNDGLATLTGTVDSWRERRTASEEALEAGAIAVDNDLEVRYGFDVPVL